MSKRPATGNPRVACGYLRCSTAEQHLSPEAQRAAILAWAAREGVDVVAWHVDAGVSGGCELDARPALAAALGELRAIGAGVLVVAKRDRLARDTGIAIAIERAVEKSGARVVSADGSGNGDGASDVFMRRILDAAAEHELAIIRARTRAGLAVKKARGERVGAVPYGFALAADRVRLEAVASEQAIIVEARRLAAVGLSLRAVAANLSERAMLSRTAREFLPAQIARMLDGARAAA